METNDNQLLAFGGEIKALGDGRIGGYLVRFTDDTAPDLENEFFTKDTDFDIEDGDRVTVYYNHGQDSVLQSRKVGTGNVEATDAGIWVEAQLLLRDEYEKAIYELAKAGKVGWSSGTVPHLVQREAIGDATFIKSWPLGKDASITPTPAAGPELTQVLSFKNWQDANGNLKALLPEAVGDTAANSATVTDADATRSQQEQNIMSEPLTKDEVAGLVADAIKADADKREAAALSAKEQKDREVEIASAAVKAYQEEQDQKATNDPGFSAPNVAKTADVWQYDNYPAGDLAATLEIVNEAHKGQRDRNAKMVKALAYRFESDEVDDETERTGPGTKKIKTAGPLKVAKSWYKAAGIKANETNFSTNASYGDEWIGVGYSGELWEQVRTAAMVADRIPSFEFPAGVESLVIPLESTDPIWYLVAQSGDPSSATAQIANTVPAKALGTAQKTMTLGKLGSSTIYTGEMTEDAMLPFVAQLRTQIGVSGGEVLDHVCIDGDTDTSATTNINDIAGTPGGTEAFLVANGFRKSALVTTTANSRDGGALTTSDFIETVKLMGAAGKVAFDKRLTSFVIDPMTHWKAIELADVKSRDVFANPTIENGALSSIYGYEVIPSYFMHWSSLVNTSYEYLTEATGKIDLDTAADNTKGAILAVRWDYWKLGFRRRITTEVVRFPRSDAWEITSLMRFGLAQRDTEASAISYNLTV
jgi:hypothetical protein